MKKKILSLCLVVALAATAVIGGTLAYFTDSEKATNVMTIGKVDIDLEERMLKAGANYDDGVTADELVPFENNKGVPVMPLSEEYATTHIPYNKVVDVYNDGPNDAYIRTIIAIETDAFADDTWTEGMNNGYQPDALFHYQYTNQVTATEYDPIKINGKWYDVVVFDQVADAPMKKGERIQSLQAIWLDETTKQEDVAVLNGEVNVMVLAQGVQAEGFANYAEAMASFGDVTSESLATWFAGADNAVINDHSEHN